MTNQHDVSADKKGITHTMNLMNVIVVNAITALILSPVTYAADTGGPSATATCRKAYGGKVVGGKR